VDKGVRTHVNPPSVERAIVLVAFVLLAATHIPFEYCIELHTGNGAFAEVSVIEDHTPEPLFDGRDEYQKTFPPLPPTIHRARPVPFVPAFP
jgi:hypothetical protein